MRYSKSLIKTLRSAPSNCDVLSHILMYRAGMIKQESSGLYTYLPYFNMVLRKVELEIIKEMNRLDAQECKFPVLVAKELLEKSGRWTAFGEEMFSLKDRHGNEYALSPTNEEAASIIAKTYVNSFRDLPLTVYQINVKHRDEIRPKGMGRTRAFTMKDAYSFHTGEECLDKTYNQMIEGYVRIFRNLGLEAIPVNADNGTMGGSGSQEIMVLSNEGDDSIARCSKCGYAANLEIVECSELVEVATEIYGKFEKKLTPRATTIDELVEFFRTDSTHFAKSIVYKTDYNDIVVAVVRGDRDVNEVKLRNLMNAKSIELCTPEEIEGINSYIGFVGPIGLKTGVKILIDNEVKSMVDFIVGANEKDYHYINVNWKDFDSCDFVDLRTVVEGDSHSCGGNFSIVKAMELGHCFKLGKRYTERLDVTYTDSDNSSKTMLMGCYGIGLERTISAIIDKFHDDNGIIWPMPIAPFKVDLISVGNNTKLTAEEIYEDLMKAGIDTLFDERNVSVGVKFKDSDLLGIPLKVIVGKSFEIESMIEIEYRTGGKEKVSLDNLIEHIKEIICLETEKFYSIE